jgi:hypothetical protein
MRDPARRAVWPMVLVLACAWPVRRSRMGPWRCAPPGKMPSTFGDGSRNRPPGTGRPDLDRSPGHRAEAELPDGTPQDKTPEPIPGGERLVLPSLSAGSLQTLHLGWRERAERALSGSQWCASRAWFADRWSAKRWCPGRAFGRRAPSRGRARVPRCGGAVRRRRLGPVLLLALLLPGLSSRTGRRPERSVTAIGSSTRTGSREWSLCSPHVRGRGGGGRRLRVGPGLPGPRPQPARSPLPSTTAPPDRVRARAHAARTKTNTLFLRVTNGSTRSTPWPRPAFPPTTRT